MVPQLTKGRMGYLTSCVCDMWILNYDVDDHDYQVCDGDNDDDEADYIYRL